MFLKNQTDYDCGPVAVYNAIYMQTGCRLNYKELLKELKTDKDGTYDYDLHVFLAHQAYMKEFSIKKVESPTRRKVSDIIKLMLEKGAVVILGHLDHFDEWHYSTWNVSPLDGSIQALNLIVGSEKVGMSFKDFDLFKHLALKTDSDGSSPVLWAIF